MGLADSPTGLTLLYAPLFNSKGHDRKTFHTSSEDNPKSFLEQVCLWILAGNMKSFKILTKKQEHKHEDAAVAERNV